MPSAGWFLLPEAIAARTSSVTFQAPVVSTVGGETPRERISGRPGQTSRRGPARGIFTARVERALQLVDHRHMFLDTHVRGAAMRRHDAALVQFLDDLPA